MSADRSQNVVNAEAIATAKASAAAIASAEARATDDAEARAIAHAQARVATAAVAEARAFADASASADAHTNADDIATAAAPAGSDAVRADGPTPPATAAATLPAHPPAAADHTVRYRIRGKAFAHAASLDAIEAEMKTALAARKVEAAAKATAKADDANRKDEKKLAKLKSDAAKELYMKAVALHGKAIADKLFAQPTAAPSDASRAKSVAVAASTYGVVPIDRPKAPSLEGDKGKKGVAHPPTEYKGGKILISTSKQSFRTFVDKNDFTVERQFSFKHSAADGWRRACECIEDHYRH